MNAFVNTINSTLARTENGMRAISGTSDAVVDLFYKIGASRGKDITADFIAAFVQDKDLAVRVALWARDVRQGAGERKLFRDILTYLDKNNPDVAILVLDKVPELGRWDDLLIDFTDARVKSKAYKLIRDALTLRNGLAAKWMPRKGAKARELREAFGWSPKYYRKTLVELTKVVETQMCDNEWDEINFSHVPSVAAARYKKAFYRHTPAYAEYVNKLVKGDKSVKINASAVYPYDVIAGALKAGYVEAGAIQAQWDALPNHMSNENVLAMVDVSGSMSTRVGGGKSTLRAVDVAVSLGLYTADKSKGAFKDVFLAFNGEPEMRKVSGNIIQKIQQIAGSWDGRTSNTNLHKAFDMILTHAVQQRVPAADMPTTLVIVSDMQFDACGRYDDSAVQMINRKYSNAGYVPPKVVFWNVRHGGNVPAKVNDQGVALVSGFSPAIFKAILGSKVEEFTPREIMLKAIMSDRYNWLASVTTATDSRGMVRKTQKAKEVESRKVFPLDVGPSNAEIERIVKKVVRELTS